MPLLKGCWVVGVTSNSLYRGNVDDVHTLTQEVASCRRRSIDSGLTLVLLYSV